MDFQMKETALKPQRRHRFRGAVMAKGYTSAGRFGEASG
jgi:hypothetical protein